MDDYRLRTVGREVRRTEPLTERGIVMMTALANSIYFWAAMIGLLAFLAVLPTLIALARGVDDLAIIMLFNAISCTTVFCWPVALVLAIKWPRRAPTATPYQRPLGLLHAHHRNHSHGPGLNT